MPKNKIKTHSVLKNSQGFSLMIIVAVIAALGVLSALFVLRNQRNRDIVALNEMKVDFQKVAESVVPEQQTTEAGSNKCDNSAAPTNNNNAGTWVSVWKKGAKTCTVTYNVRVGNACTAVKSINVTIRRPDGFLFSNNTQKSGPVGSKINHVGSSVSSSWGQSTNVSSTDAPRNVNASVSVSGSCY